MKIDIKNPAEIDSRIRQKVRLNENTTQAVSQASPERRIDVKYLRRLREVYGLIRLALHNMRMGLGG